MTVIATYMLDLIHYGICGFVNVKAHQGAFYFLNLIDKYYKVMYICCLTVPNIRLLQKKE